MTLRRRILSVAAAAALVAAAAECGSSGSGSAPGPARHGDPATDKQLVAKAHLDLCPTSSTTVVKGGLPDLTLECLGHGPAVHLAGLAGTPTVVNIWGSWCGPCRQETPILSKVYDALKPRVRFLGIDTEDSANSALSFGIYIRPRIRYPSVIDTDKKALIGLHRGFGVPQTVFVDARGIVVHDHQGPYDDAAQLRADIAKYLHVK